MPLEANGIDNFSFYLNRLISLSPFRYIVEASESWAQWNPQYPGTVPGTENRCIEKGGPCRRTQRHHFQLIQNDISIGQGL